MVAPRATSRVGDVSRLASWLRDNACSDTLIPVQPGTKFPMRRHANEQWTWSKLQSFTSRNPDHTDYAITLKSLCVIDVDHPSIALELETRFPILLTVPRETTSRGVHYMFLRSEKCDAQGYYDSRGPVIGAVDFKTRTATGTGGIVVVSPAAGKQWVSPPWDYLGPPPEIPDDLLEAVARPVHAPRDAVFVCEGGEHLEIRGCRHLAASPLFSMFLDGEFSSSDGAPAESAGPKIPLPLFSANSVRAALKSLDAGYLSFEDDGDGRGDDTVVSEALRALDFAGFGVERVRAIREASEEMRALERVHPAMARATRLDQRSIRLGDRSLVEVDSALASTVCATALDLGGDEIRLRDPPYSVDPEDALRDQPRSPDGPEDGARLEPDPAASVYEALPSFIVDWLERYPGKLAVAGGFVTGCVVRSVPRGTDIDLFVMTSDTNLADSIVRDLRGDVSVREWAFTGYAITMVCDLDPETEPATETKDAETVQIILVLNRDAATIVNGFDIHPSRAIAFVDAETGELSVRATRTWIESVRTMAHPVMDGTWTDSSVLRNAKYAHKGFAPYIPGLDRDLVSKHQNDAETLWPWSWPMNRRTVDDLLVLEREYAMWREQKRRWIFMPTRSFDPYDRFLKRSSPLRSSDYRSRIFQGGVTHAIIWWMRRLARTIVPAYRPGVEDSAEICWRTFVPDTRCRALHLMDSGLARWRRAEIDGSV